GLVRSEFFVPAAGCLPDAAFYEKEFHDLCTAAVPLPVTIRLLDIAADKHPAWLPVDAAAGGVLGLQGVRLYDREPVHSVYRAQLAAIDALAGTFDLRVLLPCVADLDELGHWRADIRRQLTHTLPFGVMAETPAACLQIGAWLEVADFVSIGCNDLMQCLFGADRERPELRRYLDPHAPPLFRFLQQVAAAGQGQLERVQLCGVLPQLPGILPVLLGLGFRVFSVEPALLPYLWQCIANTTIGAARVLADKVCAAPDGGAVRELLTQFG
ncbi:MAG: putative PEP-binding protein, partial [Gammaproteobacteria bacterium]